MCENVHDSVLVASGCTQPKRLSTWNELLNVKKHVKDSHAQSRGRICDSQGRNVRPKKSQTHEDRVTPRA